ncbi:MAG TPA: IclR family transcriptional regulator [Anaerolineales bacterium]
MSRPVKTVNQDEARYNIRVLDRAISILSLLADGKPRTSTEISEAIELSPSTTFRMLSTLAYYHYVLREETTNQYRLGLACLELAHAYLTGNDLRRISLLELETLRNETKETVHLAVLEDMEIVYLEKLPGLHAIGLMSSRVGGRSPAYCTGVGKVLLAYQKLDRVQAYYQAYGLPHYTENTITDLRTLMSVLEAIRRVGYGFDHGEHEDEVRCVAAPIFDFTGQAIAALSISGPEARMDPIEENNDLISLILHASMNISRQLGYNLFKNSSEGR